jgi:Flp pilus assembly pilin Flp
MLAKMSHCLRDENGAEVIEYALLLGLLVVGCIVLLAALGVKITGRWQQVLDLI